MFKRERGPKMPIPQEAESKKTLQGDLGKESETKQEQKVKSGFPRQEAMREAEIKETMDDLQKIYKKSETTDSGDGSGRRDRYLKNFYGKCFAEVPEISKNRLEGVVNQFLKNLETLRVTEEAGVVISAVVNKSLEQYVKEQTEKGIEYEDIEPLTVNIKKSGIFNKNEHSDLNSGCIGYKNKEKMNWIVEGDAGDGVGTEMEGGKITVKGNAKDYVGSDMKGGEITVEGSAGLGIGTEMEGGKITVEGNAKDYVGSDMKGGEITVEGSAGEYVGRDRTGGEITIGGRSFEIGHDAVAIRAEEVAKRIREDKELERIKKRADFLKWQAENE